MRSVLVLAGCGVIGVSTSACESTEQESAKLNKEGDQLVAGQGALRLGAANHRVSVSDVTLVTSTERAAVAVRLTARSPQVDIPVLVDVAGPNNKSLYSNATGGLEASLQRASLPRTGQPEWWVDDQVLLPRGTASGSAKVKVQVGSASARHSAPPPTVLTATGVHLGQQNGIGTVSGRIVGRFPNAHSKVPVFAVAVRGEKVVAAGRAIVSPPSARGEQVTFQIFLIGNPAGAKLQLSVAPANS
jgi:hypothetical protein